MVGGGGGEVAATTSHSLHPIPVRHCLLIPVAAVASAGECIGWEGTSVLQIPHLIVCLPALRWAIAAAVAT